MGVLEEERIAHSVSSELELEEEGAAPDLWERVLARDLLAGLQHLFQAGYTHGDIKVRSQLGWPWLADSWGADH